MPRSNRILHIWACGHRRRYPSKDSYRTERHEEPCVNCAKRLEVERERALRTVEVFLDRAHTFFGNFGRVVRQAGDPVMRG